MTAVNLAAPVRDGQQVVVPVRGAGGTAASAPTAPGGGGPSAGGRRLSLSQATPEQLDELDGIGPALAARIVEHRTARGGFRSVDELRQVEGIGPKRFEALRGAVDP
jgi:competence protein ComEA